MSLHGLKNDPPQRDSNANRRWYQIRLWHLFVLMTVAVVAGASIKYFIYARNFQNARVAFYDAIAGDEISEVQRLLHRYPSLIRTQSPTLRVPGDFSIYTGGETPVGVAVMYESQETFGYLVSLRPNLNDGGEANCPPIIWAVCAKDIHYLEVLLDHGVDASLRDRNEKTASDYAVDFKKDDYLDLIASHR